MATKKTPPADSDPPTRHAIRMTFSYDGDQVKLVSQQRVEVTLPPTHTTEVGKDETGFWFVLHDAQNHSIYRRVMQNPIQHDVEVFSPQGEQNIQRLPVAKPRGTFTILVPDISGAESVALYSHPLKPGAVHLRAEEIARFKITKEK